MPPRSGRRRRPPGTSDLASLPDREPALPRNGLTRLRVDLAYDGSRFHGWAVQPGLPTLQGLLEPALERILRTDEPVASIVAGRTDAGVHALGQVCHFDVPERFAATLQPDQAIRRLARLLPPDVRVWRVTVPSAGFHARFAARFRRYRYLVDDSQVGPDPLRRVGVLWRPAKRGEDLDLAIMNEAAAPLVGEHDFLPFAKPRPGSSTVRRLTALRCVRREDDLVEVEAIADAFCHHQVRFLVGALLAVGEKRRPPSWPGAVLRAGVREPSVELLPPGGLTLVEVGYPADSDLFDQVRQARLTRAGSPAADE